MSTKKVVLDSASGQSDATLAITPGKRGLKNYKIHYTLEDGGPGKWTVLTVEYRLSNGDEGTAKASNRGRGRLSGDLRISVGAKVQTMSARVNRQAEGANGGPVKNLDPDVFS
jgi:hypothetical protein